MSEDVNTPLLETLHSGYITQGKKVEEYETKLKEYLEYPYVLTVNSATSGLTLAMRMLNLPSGSEVLTCPLTCLATNMAILAVGYKIKWVDVDKDTGNMDLNDLAKKITSTTKAILVVHWGGTPIDLDKLKLIRLKAREQVGFDIPIVEDCAHAFGAVYKGRKIGSHRNYCVFSTQAIKHLTTGDGGIITLPDEKSYHRAKLLRWFGIDRDKRSKSTDFRMEEDVKEWGYKFHMNDINAVIGLYNLPHMDKIIRINRDNAALYNTHLDLPGIELMKYDPFSSYWIYTLKVTDKKGFIDFMTSKGIMVSQVHNRNDIHSCLKEFKAYLPELDSLEKHIICIPVGWWVTYPLYIVNSIKEWSETNYSVRIMEDKDKNDYIRLINEFSKGKIGEDIKYNSDQLGDIYVIQRQNKVVGTGKIIIEPKLVNNLGHIEDVVIDPEYRKMGYGQVLVRYLYNCAKKLNCYNVVLNCSESNRYFYEKCGFKKKGLQMCA